MKSHLTTIVIKTTWYCAGINKKFIGKKHKVPGNMPLYIYRRLMYNRLV